MSLWQGLPVLGRLMGRLYVAFHERVAIHAAIGPDTPRGRRFLRFGRGSIIMWKPTTIFNENFISIGEETMIGPGVSLSAGMVPGQECITSPVVTIGDRCLIGKGSGIVGHFRIVIGNDVWTGHHVYITDQNHGYESVVLPGVTIGRHVVIGANSVVTNDIPDRSVAVGAPARVIRRYIDGEWKTVD